MGVNLRRVTPNRIGHSSRKLPHVAVAIVLAAFFAAHARAFAWPAYGDAVAEIDRLAELMEWKAGSVVADIGAGDGSFSFAAAKHVGESGKVIATEIDSDKIADIRAAIKKRSLHNVVVEESKE